jgi:hypothetical protein
VQVRIAITSLGWPRWRRKPSIQPLDLKGCADTANAIDKYGSSLGAFLGMSIELNDRMPRNSVMLVNLEVPK